MLSLQQDELGSSAAADRLRSVRLAAYGVYAAALVGIVIHWGIPTGRASLASIIVSGLAITSIGRGWRQTRQVLVDWLPFTAVLMLYDQTRGVADSLGIRVHEADILAAEKWTFGGAEPSVWLQQHLYSPTHVRWYDALCTLVYTSFFIATPVLAAVLWLRDRVAWIGFISRVIVLSVAGLITYCLFPEAPPWLAARDGLSAPVARLSARGWEWFHLGNVNTALAAAQHEGVNAVAAMPSLHTAFSTLVALTIAGRLRSRLRWLLALYPLAMGFTLVYTGEHWVLDLVGGVGYALAAHAGMSRWEARRRALTEERAGNRAEHRAEGRLENRPENGPRSGAGNDASDVRLVFGAPAVDERRAPANLR
ncbi:phosphatase PAP2 family protein [uncultured Jatrophihabitans sp.]|uniref:phosphatase PAP2 family protein n=1 Tax=uncultured Jatrophihabitans sp. TaxID=1610747 RepID=UPI0035CA1228